MCTRYGIYTYIILKFTYSLETEQEEDRLRGLLSVEYQRRLSCALQRGNARVIISRSRQARDAMGVRVYGSSRDTELDFGEGADH